MLWHARCHPVPQFIKCNNKKTHSEKKYVFLGILPKTGGLLRGTPLGMQACSTCSWVEPGAVGPFLSATQKCQEAFPWLNSSDAMFCIWCWFGFRVLLLLSAFALDTPVGFQWSTRAAFPTILPYSGLEPAPKGHAENRCTGGFAGEPGLESCPRFPPRSFLRVL